MGRTSCNWYRAKLAVFPARTGHGSVNEHRRAGWIDVPAVCGRPATGAPRWRVVGEPSSACARFERRLGCRPVLVAGQRLPRVLRLDSAIHFPASDGVGPWQPLHEPEVDLAKLRVADRLRRAAPVAVQQIE